MGLLRRAGGAFMQAGIDRGWVVGDNVFAAQVDALLQSATHEAAKLEGLEEADPWKWRCAGWPADTLERYARLERAWLNSVPFMLDALGYDARDHSWSNAGEIAANRLRKPLRGWPPALAARTRRVLLALDHYGHPFPCEDAQQDLWCAGCCNADWRVWSWRQDSSGRWVQGQRSEREWTGFHIALMLVM